MTVATYILEVDWNNDDDFSDTNENVTSDLISIETKRGRDYASQLTGRAVAGKLRATLRNASGVYSSLNAASPIYGNIVPGRKVRFRTTAPSAVTLWTGYLNRLVPVVTAGKIPKVILEASGPFSRISGKQISPAKLDNSTTGTVIDAIEDAVSWPVGERNTDTGQTTLGKWYTDRKEVLTAIREIEETEFGFFSEGANGYLNFEGRYHRLATPHTTSQATFSDAAGATNKYYSIQQQDPLREIFNDIVVEVSPLVVEGAVSILWTLNEQPTIGIGETLTWGARYPNEEVDPDLGAYVDSWTTPVATTDVTVSGVDIGDIAIAAVKSANSMKISLTNNGTAVATVTLLQARGDPVKHSAPIRITSEDSTSQTAYGQRTYTLSGPWIPDTSQARDFVNYVLSRYKDPLPALVLGFSANNDAAAMTQALSRDISDRVTIVATGTQTQLAIDSVEFFIESIQHRISNTGTRHEVIFELSDARGDAGYWTLNVSELDTNTKLAY